MRARIVNMNLEIAKKRLQNLDYAEKKFVEKLDESISKGRINPSFLGTDKFNKLATIAERVG